MTDLTANELCRQLIATANIQYLQGNHVGSLKTLNDVRAIYRDAFTPFPPTLEPLIAMVQKEIDWSQLKNW